jgi:hypothetical protein
MNMLQKRLSSLYRSYNKQYDLNLTIQRLSYTTLKYFGRQQRFNYLPRNSSSVQVLPDDDKTLSQTQRRLRIAFDVIIKALSILKTTNELTPTTRGLKSALYRVKLHSIFEILFTYQILFAWTGA